MTSIYRCIRYVHSSIFLSYRYSIFDITTNIFVVYFKSLVRDDEKDDSRSWIYSQTVVKNFQWSVYLCTDWLTRWKTSDHPLQKVPTFLKKNFRMGCGVNNSTEKNNYLQIPSINTSFSVTLCVAKQHNLPGKITLSIRDEKGFRGRKISRTREKFALISKDSGTNKFQTRNSNQHEEHTKIYI